MSLIFFWGETDDGEWTVQVVSEDFVEIPTKLIAPSKGQHKRNVDIHRVPYSFSGVYEQDAYYPEETVVMHEPFRFRDVRGAVVEIRPAQYNPVNGTMRVRHTLTLRLVPKGERSVSLSMNLRGEKAKVVDQEFYPLYKRHFVNFDETMFVPAENKGRTLIIHDDGFSSHAKSLHEHKTTKGHNVVLKSMSEVGKDIAKIQETITQMYKEEGSLTHIVLIGDGKAIPAPTGKVSRAVCDTCYVLLEGDDHHPDAFISRISATNEAEINAQLNKIFKYENLPSTDQWVFKGLGIASSEGSPTDCERLKKLEQRLLNDHTYTDMHRECDPSASKQGVIDSINSGISLICYIGHGSGTSWATTGFNVQNAHALTNSYQNPFVIDVACDNGDFALNECLAEAMLRGNPNVEGSGAIGMYASAPPAEWVPPTDMQASAVDILIKGDAKSAGAVAFGGAIEGAAKWPGYSGQYLIEGYNLFGDSGMELHTGY